MITINTGMKSFWYRFFKLFPKRKQVKTDRL